MPSHAGDAKGFPFDYYTRPLIETADAGGPVYVGRYSKRQLAGVVASKKLEGKDLSLVASVASGPNFDLTGIFVQPSTALNPDPDPEDAE